MNSSDIPSRLLKAFAVNGDKNSIATDSSSTSTSSGTATYDSGFPPITMKAISAGGIPPGGKDFNGVLYDATNKLKWYDAGGAYPFDATFASAIGGYPAGAVIPSSDFYGFWQNTIDGNSANPENSSGSVTGWVPHSFYGPSAVSISTANVTLTTLQAARNEIVLSGTLTGNRYLYVPTWVKSWRIVNNCTGSYAVFISTPSGIITVQSYPGTTMNIRCDGSGVYRIQPSLLNSTGYQYLDSGLLMQWGTVDVVPNTTVTISYPIPFQNSAFIGVASKGYAISGSDYACGIDVGKSSALITNGNNTIGSTISQGIRWIVLGF